MINATRLVTLGKIFSLTNIAHRYEVVDLPSTFWAARIATYTVEVVEAELLTNSLIVGGTKQNDLVHFCLPTFRMPHD